MFHKILIANRGEIAARIIQTARRLGIATVAVYSDADRFTLPVRLADEAVRIGAEPAAESYLNVEAILAACRETGAEAVHPGYGFLSENAEFAEKLAAQGIVFIGPTPAQLRVFGLKHTAREIASANGVPLAPGSGLIESREAALAEAARIGYPVMLKSTAGGGGIGMQLCEGPDALAQKYEAVQRMAGKSFGDARLYLERYVASARHVEVQIFGDGKGGVVAIGERDCSLQRRNQKVIEETPAPGLSAVVRANLREAALALGRAVNYASAGTVEFVYDTERDEVYFLEVNTRLQVEHPVTEAVYGIDLVEWMICQAAGDFVLPPQDDLVPKGHAIEARLYAEDPARQFQPSSGLLTDVHFPEAVRVDRWIETGTEVTPYYDPLLAKLIVHEVSREAALAAMQIALSASRVWGIETNLSYLSAIAGEASFRAGRMTTGALAQFVFAPQTVEVLVPGAQSSLQDWPGRLGYWAVGIPPSGPMDARSHQLVNRLLGNADDAATLECTMSGPSLRFNAQALIALGGARMVASLDGVPVPYWTPIAVAPGQVLTLGSIEGPGQRTYLGIRHGFDAPRFLGARATFDLGRFGGHATGNLRPGDVLHIADAAAAQPLAQLPEPPPELTHDWRVGIVYGPHGAPDFFTEKDIATLFSAEYEVHFNSARTGVRLIGPQPEWARSDGGEAGLHPSNLHDNAYAIGAIDFTGDMPIILGPDGPSLGGFVCPGVVAAEELWKIGQMKPGDRLRFHPVPQPQDPVDAPTVLKARREAGSAIVGRHERGPVPVIYRRAGEDYVLVEYGPMTLDIALRCRVQLLYEALQREALPGVIDLTPGIRSLQIHYNSRSLTRFRLLDTLARIEDDLPAAEEVVLPSRIVHLPLSWNDASVQLAMRKYQELVRPDAPWCPSNIEFIRRINGLDSVDDVRAIIFAANYLVLGLGDVYLGAPVATPIDPRHRLVTTKYNPARTWTPENAVGIGGAYLCVYGMEGPGGYQLFGRTIQMWNSWRTTPAFHPGTPWLLRFFDQIRFFPVDAAELAEAREAFPHGAYPLRIEETQFSLAEHIRFCAANSAGISAFETRRQKAFEAERQDWKQRGLDTFVAPESTVASNDDAIPAGCDGVFATMTGNVWKILVAPGQLVAAGDHVIIVEAMKMEMTVASLITGRVQEIRVQPGRTVQSGQIVMTLEKAV